MVKHRASDDESRALPANVEELRKLAEEEAARAKANREALGGGDYSSGQVQDEEFS